MKDLSDVNYILRICIRRDKMSGTITLDQFVYIRKFLEDYKIENNPLILTSVDRYESWTAATNTKSEPTSLSIKRG